MTGIDGYTILIISLASIVALVILVPIILDLLALFGIRVSLRPKFKVTRERLSHDMLLKFFLGFLSLLVIASLVLNLGWLRILLGLLFLIHFVLFRTLSSYVLRTSQGTSRNTFYLAWITFVLGYLMLPDFGDTEDSVVAFFGLVKYRPVVDMMMGLSATLIVLNIIVSLVLFARTRIMKSKEKAGGRPYI